MLSLERVSCGYGQVTAVHDLSLEIASGSLHALLGANGAGKTSTIMCIAGHVPCFSGHIRYQGEDLTHLPARARVHRGIAVVPEGRRLFADLTVQENLIVGGYSQTISANREQLEQLLEYFPRLKERLSQSAASLSGGEQQMLAIARALMARPSLLMIDELSLGLMPKVIDICYQAIMELRNSGMTVLLVEQNTERVLQLVDTVSVLESGHKVWEGSAEQARSDPGLVAAYMGLGNGV